MLKKILSITGKPGLFRIISHSPKNVIVEDIESKKRFPISARDKVVSLGDIAMYTNSDDKPLGEILDLVYETKKGEKIDIKELVDNKGLKAEFETILPDFDQDRVYNKDIKKLFTWYNLLLEAGYNKFSDEENDENKSNEEKPEEKKSENAE